VKIAELAVRRPVTTIMFFVGLSVIGLVSVTRLPLDAFPDIDLPTVIIATTYPGAGPQTVESMVTRTLEEAVSTVENVHRLTSTSQENISLLTIQFNWGTDLDQAALDLREAMEFYRGDLPRDATDPMILKFNPSSIPVLFIGVFGGRNPAELHRLATEEYVPRLERIEGVAAVEVWGGLEREIQVVLDADQLGARSISVGQVMEALRSANVNSPVGRLERAGTEYVLRSVGEFSSVPEIEDVVVAKHGEVLVRIADVAEVRDGFKETSSEVRIDGHPAVMIMIQKKSGANTVEVSRQAKSTLARLERELAGEEVATRVLMDASDFVKTSISSVREVIISGGILAVLVLLFFLRNLRSTFIVSLAIPVAVVVSFIGMKVFGLTLNMMSLSGLALGIGMVVDNAIVVMENIFRHREAGTGRREAAVTGTSEVGTAITASTLTTLAVFLPLLMAQGLAGIFFKELSLTVVFAITSSLVVALTLVPTLSSQILELHRPSAQEGGLAGRLYDRSARAFARTDEVYHRLVTRALRRRWAVIGGAAALLVLSIVVVRLRLIDIEFMPQIDQGSIDLAAEMPVGTPLEVTLERVAKLEEIVQENVPELDNLSSQVGAGEETWSALQGLRGPHSARLSLQLVPRRERDRTTEEVESELRPLLQSVPGLRVTFGGDTFHEAILGGGAPVAVEIRGYDLDESRRLARRVAELIGGIPGTADVRISREEGKPELRLEVDRERAGALGLDPALLGAAIRAKVDGMVVTRYREGEEEYDLRVRLAEGARDGFGDLDVMTVTTPNGIDVPLRNVVAVVEDEGPVEIERIDQERVVVVRAALAGRDLGGVMRDVQAELDTLSLPPGFSLHYGGSFEQMQESFANLAQVFIIAIILVYLVMASQFESLLHPFLIIFTIPLAVIGVIWMLFLTNTAFDMEAFLGLIMVSGIVVNNAIVYVDYTNLLRGRGMAVTEAVVEAGRRRLRPILMTTCTTILGLTPMALGFGSGAELRAPMARAVIGGLSVSGLLTLVVIPVLYVMVEGGRERRRGLRGRQRGESD
jgi:HAE1 family hydrophobic/amphiphilic exporter-1